MDDLYPLNRKRKADSDDPNGPQQPVAVVPQDSIPTASSAGSENAPRQSWITGASSRNAAIWSASGASKRPRLEITVPKQTAHEHRTPASRRASPSKYSPSRYAASPRHPDIEDAAGLFRATTLPLPVGFGAGPTIPQVPLINRQTLKELDLDAILRNPQLRHDLLFDPGLQFRPTSSRRKRELSERYWAAVVREIENGCTCISFDSRGKLHLPVLCICSQSDDASPTSPTLHRVQPDVFTCRMPSRIPPLLTEFLEVLLLVIQPLCTISGVYVNPGTFKSQMQEHSTQATYIRSLFDPALVEQELKHGVFNPSGLFRTIGNTLKGHCAPMRDRSVEEMVAAAESCGASPNGSSSKEAIKAIRMCMEILELMKLDIANHQLQTLRPFLIRTSGQFELRTLKTKLGPDTSLATTREWIQAAHKSLSSSQSLLLPSKSLSYASLPSNQQLYISVVRGLVDLVFNPPLTSTTPFKASLSSTTPTSPTVPSVSTPLPLFPETLYLDNHRILLLSSEAADATALYMFLLLYRQLAVSDSGSRAKQLCDADMIKMKNEIKDICGSFRPGMCFSRNHHRGSGSNTKEMERWRVVREDVVLQIARRVKDGQNVSRISSSPSRTALEPSSPPTPSTSSCRSSSPSPPVTPPQFTSPPIECVPNPKIVALGQNWAESHMQSESALSAMLHSRLRDVVFNAVLSSTYPSKDASTGVRPTSPLDLSSFSSSSGAAKIVVGTAVGSAVGGASGMEPLSDEIRSLAEKISLLALIHLNAYLPLYEKEGYGPHAPSVSSSILS